MMELEPIWDVWIYP